MGNDLTFRLFQPQDTAGLLQLWKNESEWGDLTEKQFDDWYINTPYGECLIIVAVNEKNCIVGQEVFTPSKIYVRGQEKKSIRLSAPILAKELRASVISGAHPTLEMFKLGVTAAVEAGYGIIYGFPAIAWLPFIRYVAPQVGLNPGKFISAQLQSYELFLKSSSDGELKTDTNTEVSLVSEFGEDYDFLWESAKKDFPINCAVARNSNWLRWKLGGHKVLNVHRAGELIGYAAIREADGLLVDALAGNGQNLETTVTAVINSLIEREDLRNQVNTDVIRVMRTEALASIIEKLKFELMEFKFAFCCYSPDNSTPVKDLELSEWYVMPND
jgi:hypothetical protein